MLPDFLLSFRIYAGKWLFYCNEKKDLIKEFINLINIKLLTF